MIRQLKGKITHIDDKYAILETGGIGFRVYLSSDALLDVEKKKEKETSLWTYLSVKDDSLDLYGFQEKTELDFFEKLISVSGIGPKKGLGILSVAPVETLKRAIISKDISYLTQVSGIGKKNAEKIVLDLRDKFSEDEISSDTGSLKEESDIVLAIKSLGYSTQEARQALKNIPEKITGVSDKVKWILKELGK